MATGIKLQSGDLVLSVIQNSANCNMQPTGMVEVAVYEAKGDWRPDILDEITGVSNGQTVCFLDTAEFAAALLSWSRREA